MNIEEFKADRINEMSKDMETLLDGLRSPSVVDGSPESRCLIDSLTKLYLSQPIIFKGLL